jgi:hypothetical protein
MARVMRSHSGREQPPPFPLPRSYDPLSFPKTALTRERSPGRHPFSRGRVFIGFLLLVPTPNNAALPYAVITELQHGGGEVGSELIPRL